MLAVVLADLVDRHDAGVVEQRDRLGLVLEPPQLVVAGQDAGPDHLQGDGPVEADLPGPVDDAHAAAAELGLDLVVAEVADDGTRRGRRCGTGWIGSDRLGERPGRPSKSGSGPVSWASAGPARAAPSRQAGQRPRGASSGRPWPQRWQVLVVVIAGHLLPSRQIFRHQCTDPGCGGGTPSLPRGQTMYRKIPRSGKSRPDVDLPEVMFDHAHITHQFGKTS